MGEGGHLQTRQREGKATSPGVVGPRQLHIDYGVRGKKKKRERGVDMSEGALGKGGTGKKVGSCVGKDEKDRAGAVSVSREMWTKGDS